MRGSITALALAATFAAPAAAKDASSQAQAQALDLLKRGLAFRTVAGPGNQTPEYATMLRDALIAGGFAPSDVTITRLDDTAYLVARYPGTEGTKLKPIGIVGHMDVVEARRADWERDPFTPVIENGYIYGRGATDMKYDLSTMVASLIELKREGFRPKRDILLFASGDEETSMKTTAALAAKYHDLDLLLNIDAGGGHYSEAGKPDTFGLQAAEKTYADIDVTVTDPGGHSSAPRPVNAIVTLSRALERIGAYRFPAEINEITRISLAAAAQGEEPEVADAIRAFLVDQTDAKALAVLRARPALVGQIGTTCVPTMVTAGHAPNALPQRASANVNCRIFPGTTIESVVATLTKVAAEPSVTVTYKPSGTIVSPASPLRPDVMKAVSAAVLARFPAVKVVPGMSAGATDSMHFRARGVPSYGISPIFMKDSDSFSHGLNERTPLSELGPSVTYYKRVLADLAR
ncbi:M20/M25/M40 family metallo-hydrolase [Sphingomonas sp.]|uniref:M20/M25/M40 family metallo-hydrolase n=1 Tax=Sphingomonas sp. TaxID=28214 RepID=UPI001EB0EDC4|nr:M20/M25/M40 family metallo-hydrolase [Sphingomonas sp.]MBX3593488.1 M20/M25/M40 family metallo-hydrolase [Sphingomonas sp.]